jgi:hypothetical protein
VAIDGKVSDGFGGTGFVRSGTGWSGRWVDGEKVVGGLGLGWCGWQGRVAVR